MADANLFTYIDEEMSVLDDTIITLNINSSYRALAIPASVEGHTIRKIGKSLFYDNANIRMVELSDGIEEIGEDVFKGAANLIELRLPASIKSFSPNAFWSRAGVRRVVAKRRLANAEYVRLKNSSFMAKKEGCLYYILKDPAIDIEELKVIYDGIANIAKPIPFLEKTMEKVCLQLDSADRDRSYDSLMVYELGGDIYMSDDLTVAKSKADNRANEYRSRGAERETNTEIKKHVNPLIEKTVLTMFDDSATVAVDGGVICTFYFEIDFYFWPSVITIPVENEKYYVYRRNHFNSDSNAPYVRVEKDIFTIPGHFIEDDIKEKVLEKYRTIIGL